MKLYPLLTSLRPRFIIAFVVVWNALCFTGIWLNGGTGRITTLPSVVFMFIACAGVAFIGFGALTLPRFRALVLRPNVDIAVVRPGLVLLGILGTLLALGTAITAYDLLQAGVPPNNSFKPNPLRGSA
jgi:hypothetical protein